MSINSSAGIFEWGPTGRSIKVDASGRLLTTGDPVGGLYPVGYGQTGRALCVDASGYLAVTSTGSSGGSINNGINLGDGSGIFAGKAGSNLTFKTLHAGSGIKLEADASGVTINNTYEDDVQDIRIDLDNLQSDFDNASGVWAADISATTAVANGVRTDFTNSSGIFQAGTDKANQVRIDFDNSSGVWSDIDLQGAFDNGSNILLADDPISIFQSGNAEAIKIDSAVDQEAYPAIYASQTAMTQQDESANTGTDETLGSLYEAIKFTASGTYEIRSFGVRIKRTGTITNTSDLINGYIYTDNAGKPGIVIGSISTYIRLGMLTTSYVKYTFRVNASVAYTTSYWAVLKYSSAPAGGTVEIDGTNVGTALHAYSANGSSWTTEDNKHGWLQLYGRTNNGIYAFSDNGYALYAYSPNNDAIYGYSLARYGVYGYSINNIGVRGKSDWSIGVYGSSTVNIGVQGVSTTLQGVRGDSTNSYGVYGTSTNSHGVFGHASSTGNGVYGEGTNAPGVYGTSTNSHGVYGYASAASKHGVVGQAVAGCGGYFEHYANNTNGLVEIVRISRYCHTSTPASGIGGALDFYITNKTPVSIIAGRISTILVNPTAGSETSRVGICTRNAGGALTERLTVMEDGALRGNNNTWDVDADGNATFNTVSIPGDAYKESIASDSWTHDGSGLYYHDVTHSLNTRDIMVELYDSATYRTILADDIERTDVNTVRVTVNASGLSLRALFKTIS